MKTNIYLLMIDFTHLIFRIVLHQSYLYSKMSLDSVSVDGAIVRKLRWQQIKYSVLKIVGYILAAS